MKFEDLTIGDVVTLMGSDYKMTVSELRNPTEAGVIQVVTNEKDRKPVTVMWFDLAGKLNEAEVDYKVLTKVS